MPFDGIVTSAVVWELKGLLTGGRIEKVYQTEKDEIMMLVHSAGERVRLLMSASTKYPRMHLTKSKKENPSLPPQFCMVLRKHIQGGRIITITQTGYDRIVNICIEISNEMGDIVQKNLIIEIMGKHSNIILTNSKGIILDAIKHVDERISSVREVLPLRIYIAPPPQEKLSPAKKETVDRVIEIGNEIPSVRIDKHILNNISGFSPFLSVSICNRANIDSFKTFNSLSQYDKLELKECLYNVINDIRDNKYSPVILQGDKKEFHVLEITKTGDIELFNTVNLMLDEFYTQTDAEERLTAKKSSLLKNINLAIERNKRKLLLQEDTMRESANYDEYRVKGELLYSNIYRLKESLEAEVENYYENPPVIMKIELNPDKSISNNANIYFKKYRKLKSSYENASMHIQETTDELFYLENVKTLLDICTEFTDIQDIKQELTEQGYLKFDNKKNKKMTRALSSGPIYKLSSEGYDIFIGKNNKQNDELTLRKASSNDMWLHVKNAPGSHVIIRTGAKNGIVTNSVIQEAASYAAYYSSQRSSTNVVVDFTRVKNVKKPQGARPGMVNYVNYKSTNVKPSNYE